MGFRGDERGQSEVIGALLIFAVIVAFIGLNQAFLVPQANEEIEFKHHNDVQRDMVDLRSGLVEAAASNDQRSRTLTLGTDYPSRFVAINPPPATGTLRTVDAGATYDSSGQEVNGRSVVTRACDTGSTTQDPKFLEYRPHYNEYDNAIAVNVENTVTYRSTASGPLFNTQQTVVRGNQINIIRIVGDVDEQKEGTVSVDLVPSSTGVRTVEVENDGGFSLSIPTRLSAYTWSNQQLGGKVMNVQDDGDRVTMEFESGEYTVKCTTVGVNEEPDVSPVALSNPETGDDASNFVNPRENVIFKGATIVDDRKVEIELENHRDEDVDINEARFTFYSVDSQGDGTRKPPESAEYGNETFNITGDIKPVNGDRLPAEDSTNITVEFIPDGGTGNGTAQKWTMKQGDWFFVFLRFAEDSGDEETFSGTYFVPPQDS